jgi:Glycosyl hydrolases family 35
MQNYIDRHETSQLLSKTTLSDKRVYTAIECTSYKNDGEMCQKDEENVHTSTKSINFKFMVGLTVLFLVVLVASILVVEHTRDITQYSLFKYIPTSFFFGALLRYHHHRHIVYHHIPRDYNNRQLRCSDNICFQPPQPDNDTPQVATNRPGFPSYWNHATGVSPIDVSYDERSILLNGQRSLFIGGSMHPARATPLTWEHALDRAVDNGLNLITVYVIWASHQPTANSTLDWNLTPRPISGDSTEWSISSAIRSAAKRGLFVHVRVGPFVCGEYNYGGIPEWVPLLHPDMELRRLDSRWMDIMEQYVSSIVSYLQKERLFAYQGGPIIMAQIENEINGDVETGVVTSDDDHISYSDVYYSERRSTSRERVHGRHQNGRILRQSSSSFQSSDLQGYAEWSGQLAKKLAPEVVWTMCNGLSASNTIETYNGQFFDVSWLENYGASHRIQVDRPALWTEHEGTLDGRKRVIVPCYAHIFLIEIFLCISLFRRIPNLGR